MNLEQWIHPATLFALIAAVPGFRLIFNSGWRWKLGARGMADYTRWIWNSHFRSYPSNALFNRLLRAYLKIRMWPAKCCSRLASEDLKPRFVFDEKASPLHWPKGPTEHESKALANARRIITQRETEEQRRYHHRRQKMVRRSTCDIRPKKPDKLFCSSDCCLADDPLLVPHYCDEHRHNALGPHEPELTSKVTQTISMDR